MLLTFVVRLEAMRFHTRIGVLPHEAEIAQAVEVDVSVWVSRDETARGAEGVLDYRRLYDLVSGIIAEGHILYLEDLVSRVVEGALKMDGVLKVIASARKPQVALAGPLAHAQVTLERSRDD